MQRKRVTPRRDLYSTITAEFVQALSDGVIPWRKPWRPDRPRNVQSGREYHGINLLLLHLLSDDTYFVTFKQAEQLGGAIRRGAKSFPILFWSAPEASSDEAADVDDRPEHPVVRHSRVFGLSQTVGIDPPDADPSTANCPVAARDILDAAMPEIRTVRNPAYYPHDDLIGMPSRSRFVDEEHYLSTLFHELIHWTGHPSRLGRLRGTTRSEDLEGYGIEELTAEIGASFLCAYTGIRNERVVTNQHAYVQGWAKALTADNRMVARAAGRAARAVDLLLGNLEPEPPGESVEGVASTAPIRLASFNGREGAAVAGSQYWLQEYVNEMPEAISWAIVNECVDISVYDYRKICWISPLAGRNYRLHRDDLLTALGLERYQQRLDTFWPPNMPEWDGLSVMQVSNEAIFLVEAKAYLQETRTSMKAKRPESVQMIRTSLKETQSFMQAVTPRDWTKPYYQVANRLAFLYFLRVVCNQPAYLAFVNFMDDRTVKYPASRDDWQRHFMDVYTHLGITRRSPLMERVLEVHLSARE